MTTNITSNQRNYSQHPLEINDDDLPALEPMNSLTDKTVREAALAIQRLGTGKTGIFPQENTSISHESPETLKDLIEKFTNSQTVFIVKKEKKEEEAEMEKMEVIRNDSDRKKMLSSIEYFNNVPRNECINRAKEKTMFDLHVPDTELDRTDWAYTPYYEENPDSQLKTREIPSEIIKEGAILLKKFEEKVDDDKVKAEELKIQEINLQELQKKKQLQERVASVCCAILSCAVLISSFFKK
jgi:hypothetical protein